MNRQEFLSMYREAQDLADDKRKRIEDLRTARTGESEIRRVLLGNVADDDGNFIHSIIFVDSNPFVTDRLNNAQRRTMVGIILDIMRFEKDAPELPEHIRSGLDSVVTWAEHPDRPLNTPGEVEQLYDKWRAVRDAAKAILYPDGE